MQELANGFNVSRATDSCPPNDFLTRLISVLKNVEIFFNTFQRSGLKSRILTGIDNGDEAGLLLPGRSGSSASGTPIVTGCESDQVALGYQKPNFQHFSTKKK